MPMQKVIGQGWDNAKLLEIENNIRYGKYKELAHIACLTISINQPSLAISPIWIHHISNEVDISQKISVWSDRFLMGFYKVSEPNVQFVLHRRR